MKYKIVSKYNGSKFHGWQKQKNTTSTVQTVIERAILNTTGEKVSLVSGGRTDAGVHASNHTSHFSCKRKINPTLIMHSINKHIDIPHVEILDIEIVNEEFNARFSATFRNYIYVISLKKKVIHNFNKYEWEISKNLDIENMKEAAKFLIGKHDLSAFCSKFAQENKNTLRTITHIKIKKIANKIFFSFRAPSFLHNQVRIIIGTLVDIFGIRKTDPTYMKYLIECKDREKTGPTAPPNGLYLRSIEY